MFFTTLSSADILMIQRWLDILNKVHIYVNLDSIFRVWAGWTKTSFCWSGTTTRIILSKCLAFYVRRWARIWGHITELPNISRSWCNLYCFQKFSWFTSWWKCIVFLKCNTFSYESVMYFHLTWICFSFYVLTLAFNYVQS